MKCLKANKYKKMCFVTIIGLIGIFSLLKVYNDKSNANLKIVTDLGYDVKLAIKVNDKIQNSIPESEEKVDDKYYRVAVNCNNNIQSEWDYNAWDLKVDGVVKDSACTLSFTSNMTSLERDNIINEGIAKRRNTYRGKNITEYKNLPETDSMNLYKQISNGTFDDIYVGDYIVSDTKIKINGVEEPIIWLIADIDNYWKQGDSGDTLTKHHVTVIPAGSLMNSVQMNSSATTNGGYAGSTMYKTTLTNVLNTYVTPDFNGHILTYRNLVTNSMNGNLSNMYGSNSGATNGWTWDNRQIDLMSEANVYGTTVWSSSGYDIKLNIEVDGKTTDVKNIPTADEKVGNNYYKVTANCDNGVTYEWDYNAWNLKLSDVVSGSKCTLIFTSNMSEEERNDIIREGVAKRRNTYRGKDITEYKDDGSLYDMIKSGKFDDIYVGDYIKGKNGITWLIADIDNYLNQGDTPLTKHHVTVIPAGSLTNARMNSSDTTTGGYAGSEMYKSTLNTILKQYITPDFNGHILTYRNIVTNSMSGSLSNMYGSNTGASNGWTWDDRQIDLMSEVNVLGTTVWSSSGYDIGIDNRQYAIFQLRPELITQDLNGSSYQYWLKVIARSDVYCTAVNGGTDNRSSWNPTGVRPRFLIG